MHSSIIILYKINWIKFFCGWAFDENPIQVRVKSRKNNMAQYLCKTRQIFFNFIFLVTEFFITKAKFVKFSFGKNNFFPNSFIGFKLGWYSLGIYCSIEREIPSVVAPLTYCYNGVSLSLKKRCNHGDNQNRLQCREERFLFRRIACSFVSLFSKVKIMECGAL